MNPILLMAQAGGTASGSAASPYSSILLMVALFGIMYFVMIRPQRKRQKEEREMRSSLEIGDEIITIGGIVGKVVTIREQDIMIVTGPDKTKMNVQRWAVNTNVTKTEQHKKEVEAARAAAKEKKANKKESTPKISDTAKEAEEKIEK